MSTDNSFTEKQIQPKENNWREQVLNGLLHSMFVFGFLTLAVALTLLFKSEQVANITKAEAASIYIFSFVLLGIITFVEKIPYTWKSITLLFILYLLGVIGLLGAGLSGDGRLFIITFIVVTAILFDIKRGIFALVFGVGTLLVAAILFTKGIIYIPPEILANSAHSSAWTTGIIVLILLSVLLIVPISYLIKTLEYQSHKAQNLLQDVTIQHETLEKLVEERTRELEHRAKQLELSAQVAHDTLSFTDIDELLFSIVRLIAEEFAYYHVGIFLLENNKEYVVLQATSSTGGMKMMERGYQLRVGSGRETIGRVAAEHHPVITQGDDFATQFNNPDLPETRSEMALPLLSQNELIGVLDIQSNKPQAFTQEDVEIFQLLAGQLALAIQNKRLFAETQANIEQLETLTAQQTQTAWRAHLKQQSHRFLYTPLGIKPLRQSQPFESDDNEELVHLPIMLQGKSIGSIAMKRPAQPWTEKEKALIADISAQIGLAVENARLVEETQRQAQEEQLVSEFSAKLRETLDMDAVVKTAIDEMKKTFDLKEIEVRLTDN
jgi:GAF domain-containing protein